jgi:hypothetical protein
VIEYRSKVIALCQAEDSIAKTTEAKVAMAHQLVERTHSAGIPLDEFYLWLINDLLSVIKSNLTKIP